MGRESQGITRTIKEAMYLWVNDAPLNWNLVKYQLPHIWDGVLQDMLALCLQWSPLHAPPSTTPIGHPLTKGAYNNFFLGMSSKEYLTSPYPSLHFGSYFFPLYFGTKLVSITFSLISEEVLLVLTILKLVWYMYIILFLLSKHYNMNI